MDVLSFPNSRSSSGQTIDAVRIDHLLTLTNSRLFRLTGNPDVMATRLGLRHLRRLGLTALVYGMQAQVAAVGRATCANDERQPGG